MAGHMRIGEVSRRSGVAPELLRAWERRYDLLAPTRSPGGYRLYSDDDLARLRAMQGHLAAGLSAAEAAVLARSGPATDETTAVETPTADLEALRAAFERFDEAAAHAVLDRALAGLTTDAVITGLVLPYLADLGERWSRGEVSVAQEHFASNALRGRLLGLARGWDRGTGPRAVLACAPGEMHDLGLISFGLALRARGWRIVYLGADTPISTIADAARRLPSQVVVVSATAAERLAACSAELERVAAELPLAVAGAGATAQLSEALGARRLVHDPVSEAERLTRELGQR